MNFKKFSAVTICLALILSAFSLNAFAVSTKASVPIKLTVSNEYRAVSVTVPASLPIEVHNGVVITADNAAIKNNAKYGSVKVTAVNLSEGSFKIGDYDSFSGKNKTLAMKINGIASAGKGNLNITEKEFPVIPAGESLKLTYFAKISSDIENVKDSEIANVIFTITLAD